jgi:hypothetical protein
MFLSILPLNQFLLALRYQKYFLLVVFLGLGLIANAQSPIKTHNHQDLVWLGYFPKLDISHKWAIDADYQFRRKDWFKEWSQKVFRQALSYKANENLVFSAGFAHLQHHKVGLIQREYRPYQQILVLNNFAGIKLDHRYRFEQRFIRRMVADQLAEGYMFNYRVRYKVTLGIPIRVDGEETRWGVYVDNEILVNFGEEIFINFFDQNRFSFGVNYKATENIKMQLGYMNLFAQKPRIGHFDDANIIRFNIYHRFKFYKESEPHE